MKSCIASRTWGTMEDIDPERSTTKISFKEVNKKQKKRRESVSFRPSERRVKKERETGNLRLGVEELQVREERDHGGVVALSILLKDHLGLVGLGVGDQDHKVFGELGDSLVQLDRGCVLRNGGNNGVGWRFNRGHSSRRHHGQAHAERARHVAHGIRRSRGVSCRGVARCHSRGEQESVFVVVFVSCFLFLGTQKS